MYKVYIYQIIIQTCTGYIYIYIYIKLYVSMRPSDGGAFEKGGGVVGSVVAGWWGGGGGAKGGGWRWCYRKEERK